MKSRLSTFYMIKMVMVAVLCGMVWAAYAQVDNKPHPAEPEMVAIEGDTFSQIDKIWVSFDFVDDADLKEIRTYDLFDEDSEWAKIAFTPNTIVKDFSWLAIQFSDEEVINSRYEILEELYTIKELRPQRPFVVSWIEVGIFAHRGFSYCNETGQKVYYALHEGNYGMDPEEYEGPALVVEQFYPQRLVTGHYEYMQSFDDDNIMVLDLSETSYTLKVNDRVYKGTATIDFGDVGLENSTWFITLEGIKWDHDWSDSFTNGIPPDDQWVDKDTYDIFMWLDVDELTFQNSGNPMSPYSIFDDIPEKFPRLKIER